MKRKAFRTVGAIAGLLLLAAAVTYAVGTGIEREHEATVTRELDVPPERVWALITDVERFPTWRPGLSRVAVTLREDGRPLAWTEHTDFGPVPLRIVEWEPPRRMVGRIDAEDLGFGGTWTYELTPRDGGVTLAITERGSIDSPWFRCFAKHVFGYDATLVRVQDAIAAELVRRPGG